MGLGVVQVVCQSLEKLYKSDDIFYCQMLRYCKIILFHVVE